MTDELNDDDATPSWFIDDNVPGTGERPAWLNEKFKSAADLAKSYHELEKKFSSVPEDYDLSKSQFIDADYEPFQEFLTLAREKKVPKEVIDKMSDSIDKYFNEFTSDPKEELKKLGANAQDRIATLDNWAKANLSSESYEALSTNVKSASAIKALEEIRGKMMSNSTMVPPGNDSATNNVENVRELQDELTNNLAKYKSDPHYRKDLQGRIEKAAKTSNYIDKS